MVNIDKIKNLAKAKGISVAFICESVGKTRTFLNDVKHRNGDISDENLKIIAEILGTTPEYLRDETNVKEKSPEGLNDREQIALDLFNSLSDEQQEHFLSIMRSLVAGQNGN